ncbi:tRNA1(Val) (adenine(37)-N6)-methyltransferase, partial [Clarias magur]
CIMVFRESRHKPMMSAQLAPSGSRPNAHVSSLAFMQTAQMEAQHNLTVTNLLEFSIRKSLEKL